MSDLKSRLEDLVQVGTAYLCFCVGLPVVALILFEVESLWVMGLSVGVTSVLGVLAWRRLTGSPGPDVRRTDPVFEEMRWIDEGGPRLNFWEGTIEIDAAGGPVDVCIYAGESGPSDEQRAMVPVIRDQYAANRSKMRALLEEATGQSAWDFVLLSISIEQDTAQQRWSASSIADTDKDGDMGYEIDFKNGEIDGIHAGD